MSRPVGVVVELDADVEAVVAVLTGPRWAPALDARLRDGSTLVSSAPTPEGGTRVVQSRRLPEGVPSALQRFVPQDGRVTQTDVWAPPAPGDPVRSGTWAVALPGSPGQVGGSTRVEPAGPGSRWVVTGTVTVGVPLLGGRLEAFLAPLVERLVAAQGEVLRGLLEHQD